MNVGGERRPGTGGGVCVSEGKGVREARGGDGWLILLHIMSAAAALSDIILG